MKMKKLLAAALAATMLFSTMVTSVVASAETPTNAVVVEIADIAVDATEYTADINITFDAAVEAPHLLFDVDTDEGTTLTNVVSNIADEVNIDAENGGANLPEGKFLVEGKGSGKFVNAISLTATFALAEAAKADDVINVTVTVTDNADWSENTLTIAAGSDTYTVLAPVVECDHANATSEVTTKPTKDAEGVRTYTCECGETWTAPIAVATKINTSFGWDIALDSSIAVGFTFKKADTKVDEAVDVYGYSVKNVYVGNDVAGQEYEYYEKEDFYDRATGSTPRKVVKYMGITAKDMSNDIYTIIYFENADGTFTYMDETFKLTDYVDGMLPYYPPTSSEKNRKFVTLLIDMVNYGAAAQIQFNYNTANLPNAAYSDYMQYATQEITEYPNAAVDTPLTGATHKLTATLAAGSTISILNSVRLANNTKLTSKDSLAGYYAKYVWDGGSKIIPAEDFIIDGEVKIQFSEFTTRDRLKPVNVTLYDSNDNPVSNTWTYSIASYCATCKDYYAIGNNLRTLSDNLLKFCNAAEDYFSA